jgi:hypothetical protein
MIRVSLGIGKFFESWVIFKGLVVKKSFFQLCACKIGFHLHLLHLVVFFLFSIGSIPPNCDTGPSLLL